MGVPGKKMVYDFRRKFNSVNSGRNRDIALVDIISYLNEAKEIWFENRVKLAQTDQRVRNDLRIFKKDYVELQCSPYKDGSCIAKFPNDLYERLNQVAVVRKDCCKDSKEIIPRITTSDKLHEARHNNYRQADFFYEQLLAVEAADGLIVYHDNEMNVDKVLIDYYRKPNDIHAPSLEECDDGIYYDYCGVVISEDSDFEVDATYAANMVVDIAVLKASRDVNDVSSFQTQLNQIFAQGNMGN